MYPNPERILHREVDADLRRAALAEGIVVLRSWRSISSTGKTKPSSAGFRVSPMSRPTDQYVGSIAEPEFFEVEALFLHF